MDHRQLAVHVETTLHKILQCEEREEYALAFRLKNDLMEEFIKHLATDKVVYHCIPVYALRIAKDISNANSVNVTVGP